MYVLTSALHSAHLMSDDAVAKPLVYRFIAQRPCPAFWCTPHPAGKVKTRLVEMELLAHRCSGLPRMRPCLVTALKEIRNVTW